VTRGVVVALALAAAGAPFDSLALAQDRPFDSPALAQGTAPARAQTAPPPGVAFFSRFDFHVSMEHLVSEEPRFVWDAHFGGELDMIEYGSGRATFVANYETVLGSEFRAFDPNQGNYILEGSISRRAGGLEAAGVFHHVSRHLSDRPKRFPVDWNMIGGRIGGSTTRGRTTLRARADVRGVIQNTFVDYRWEVESAAAVRVGLRPGVVLVSSGGVRVLGVDGSRDRGTQYGYRGEGGVRLDGRGAALELFIAAERRIDPYQLEFSTSTWMTLGFRISSPSLARMP
jgi:hypothetical protein